MFRNIVRSFKTAQEFLKEGSLSYQTLGKVASIATVAGLLYQLQSNLRHELRSDYQELKTELKHQIETYRQEARADHQELKTELKHQIETYRQEARADQQSLKEELNMKLVEGFGRIEHMMYELRVEQKEQARDFYSKRN